jgi:hypothetical protein
LPRISTRFRGCHAGYMLAPEALGHGARISSFWPRYAIPTTYEQREFATAGELMSYGTSLNEASRQVGV